MCCSSGFLQSEISELHSIQIDPVTESLLDSMKCLPYIQLSN